MQRKSYKLLFGTTNILIVLFLASVVFGITGNNIVSEITELIVDATEPGIYYVNVTPNEAFTNDTLKCGILVYDATTNATANITWIVNGTIRLTETRIAIVDNTPLDNLTELTSGYFLKHHNVSCNLTVNDSAGNINTSSELIEIQNRPPYVFNLSYPDINDELFTNRTPTFNWTNGTDIDNDFLTYELEIDTNNDWGDGVFFRKANITTNKYFYNDSELAIDLTYYWRVRANDSENYSNWTQTFNFTVASSASLTLVNISTDFGLLDLGIEDDTEDSDPYPITIENSGNVRLNVNVSSDRLWVSTLAPLNTSYFQFKANRSIWGELTFDMGDSQLTWQNVSDTPLILLYAMNWTDNNDMATTDIRIEVPLDENPGVKNATFVFQAEES